MVKMLHSLDVIDVASPCPADWDDMTGDDRTRFCSQCNLNVYNLSDMSEDEALDLVRSSEGRLCVRFFRRADGTVLTKDCPVGLRAVRMKIARMWAGATALAASVIFGSLLPKLGFAREPVVALPVLEVKGDVCIDPKLVMHGQINNLAPAKLVEILRGALKAEFDATGGMPDPTQKALLPEKERQDLEAKLTDPKWQAPKAGTPEHQQLLKYCQQAMANNPALMQPLLTPAIRPHIHEAVLGKIMIKHDPLPELPRVALPE